MTIEEKVDLILNHMRLSNLLFEAKEEKNNNVRKQDFEAASKSRDKEVEITKRLTDNARKIESLLNSIDADERSIARDDAQGTDAGKQK